MLTDPKSINLNRFTENSYQGYNLSLLFADESTQQIKQLVEKIATIANESGISVIQAGREFPIHATLADGRYKGEEIDIIELYRYMQTDSDIVKTSASVTGLQIPFKYLLIDGANVLLTADEIPKGIVEVRKYFKKNLLIMTLNLKKIWITSFILLLPVQHKCHKKI